jgi:hypothetical protein
VDDDDVVDDADEPEDPALPLLAALFELLLLVELSKPSATASGSCLKARCRFMAVTTLSHMETTYKPGIEYNGRYYLSTGIPREVDEDVANADSRASFSIANIMWNKNPSSHHKVLGF